MVNWSRAFRQAGSGAITGAVALSMLVHSYCVLTDSPALKDGQYAMLPFIYGPPGALIGGIVGFIAGAFSDNEERASR